MSIRQRWIRAASVTVVRARVIRRKRRNGSTPARSIIPRRSFTFQRLHGSNIFTESDGTARFLTALLHKANNKTRVR